MYFFEKNFEIDFFESDYLKSNTFKLQRITDDLKEKCPITLLREIEANRTKIIPKIGHTKSSRELFQTIPPLDHTKYYTKNMFLKYFLLFDNYLKNFEPNQKSIEKFYLKATENFVRTLIFTEEILSPPDVMLFLVNYSDDDKKIEKIIRLIFEIAVQDYTVFDRISFFEFDKDRKEIGSIFWKLSYKDTYFSYDDISLFHIFDRRGEEKFDIVEAKSAEKVTDIKLSETNQIIIGKSKLDEYRITPFRTIHHRINGMVVANLILENSLIDKKIFYNM